MYQYGEQDCLPESSSDREVLRNRAEGLLAIVGSVFVSCKSCGLQSNTHLPNVLRPVIHVSGCALPSITFCYSLGVKRSVVDLYKVLVRIFRRQHINLGLRQSYQHHLLLLPVTLVSSQGTTLSQTVVFDHTVMPISISSHCFMGAIRFRYETHVSMFSLTGSSTLLCK